MKSKGADSFSEALPRGTLLRGRYEVEQVLGQGGFGITYLAHDTRLLKHVAVKEFFPVFFERGVYVARKEGQLTVAPNGDRASKLFQYGLTRFLDEARTLARFDDPGIVRVIDHFEEHATAYLIMKYYRGESLEEHLARQGGRLEALQAVDLVLPVLEALRKLHAQGILHRDIKPSNIMRIASGQVVLLDFGAARYALDELTHHLTPMGTPGYAPWEQMSHSEDLQGPWTDVYACGALLYRMMTGEVPRRRSRSDLKPPAEVVPAIPPGLSEAVMKALAVQPKNRFATIEALQSELRERAQEHNESGVPRESTPQAGAGPDTKSPRTPLPEEKTRRGDLIGLPRKKEPDAEEQPEETHAAVTDATEAKPALTEREVATHTLLDETEPTVAEAEPTVAEAEPKVVGEATVVDEATVVEDEKRNDDEDAEEIATPPDYRAGKEDAPATLPDRPEVPGESAGARRVKGTPALRRWARLAAMLSVAGGLSGAA